MSLNFTEAQLQSVRNGQPLRFTEDDTDFVLVRADQYERVGLLQMFGKRAGWDEPELDVYETFRKAL